MAGAEAELSVITNRQPVPAAMTAAPPVLHVLPYAGGLIPSSYIRQAYVLQSVLMLLLVICCSNVATLLFARTVTRQRDPRAHRARRQPRPHSRPVLRRSPGPRVARRSQSPARCQRLVQWTMRLIWESGSRGPFWWDDRIAPVTYLYAGGLTLLVAALCGMVLALKSTRGGVHAGIDGHARGERVVRLRLDVSHCGAGGALRGAVAGRAVTAWDAVKAQAGGTGFASRYCLCRARC